MTQTAFKKYAINDITAGDIVSESLATTLGTFGASTITWQRIGKLYFNVKFLNGGGLDVMFGAGFGGSTSDAQATLNQVATILGKTINTYYIVDAYGPYIAQYSGGIWSGSAPGNNTRKAGLAFLVN